MEAMEEGVQKSVNCTREGPESHRSSHQRRLCRTCQGTKLVAQDGY